MKPLFLMCAILCVLPAGTYAQQPVNEMHLHTIHAFVEGYNTQDFDKMSGTLSPLMKLVFTDKRIEEIYSMQYALFGKASVHKITPRSSGSYYVDLKYETDTTEVERLGLSVSGKNKIIGMGSSGYKHHTPKTIRTDRSSDETLLKQLDSLVQVKYAHGGFNGCVLVVHDKSAFYTHCAGYADMAHQTPLNEHTMFDLASCSKQFTAMAIMMLAEQGKLTYAQNIATFFPAFPYKDITIEQLLTHTSGLPDYMEILDAHWDKTKVATNQDVINLLTQYKPKRSFKPGTAYEYSNTGYVMLASIIEKVSGMSFADFLATNIFLPLGMENTLVHNTKYSDAAVNDQIALGHTLDPVTKQHVWVGSVPELDFYRYMDGITGDGAVHASIRDMGKWTNALRDHVLVQKSTFERAIKPHVTKKGETIDYGFGWELQTNDAFAPAIYHSGNWGGNFTYVLHYLDRDLSVIILSNNEYFNIQKFAGKIADIMTR